ncbi:MAG: biopolymer transporter ExbD [Deltaproteobacteria bacterium]|nr:MAG: biopolymer transporter ExbD [Deltaproteobacteria bacterium]
MASISAPGGRSSGGKKQLNVELNLVPFIDLLTCLICFLLMAAVWIQVGKISVTQSGQGAPTEQTPEQRQQLNLVVTITPQGLIVTGNGQTIKDIVKKDNAYDFHTLGTTLKEIHGQFPDKNDIVVMAEDSIQYQDLINTMDVCLANDFPNISVSGTF